MEAVMNKIRSAAVAGQFYPAKSSELSALIKSSLADINQSGQAPKAIIAPHAGYIYSGPIAASAYASLASTSSAIRRVVLLGPAHRMAFEGLATTSHDAFETPLGNVPVEPNAIQSLLTLPQVKVLDEAHTLEHSLEVHLPFLQVLLDDFQVIPLLVGQATKEDVAEALQSVWGGDETLIVISSDLSHYQNYDTAKRMDKASSALIEKLDANRLNGDMACGYQAINGLLHLAKQKHLKARTLDCRNSGDTAGSKDRVVGYGAYAFH